MLVVLGTLLAGASIVRADDAPLTVCDALNRRAELNHKVIAIRGYELADEGTWLMSDKCDSLVTKDHKWSAMIYIEADSAAREKVGFKAEPYQTEQKKINAELQKQGYDRKRHQMWLTYVGRLESFEDLRAQGRPAGSGYGHLGAAPARLIVSEVKDVALKPWPTKK